MITWVVPSVTGSLGRYDNAEDFVDAYHMWWKPTVLNASGGLDHVPDILTFIQTYLNVNVGGKEYLPDAVGEPIPIWGVLSLTADEAELVHAARDALLDPTLYNLLELLSSFFNPVAVLGPVIALHPGFNAATALSAVEKLVE